MYRYNLLFAIFSSIFVIAAGRAAPVTSGKRKSTADEVGSSTKRVALELFPTHPKQNELNIQSFASLVNRGLDDDTNVQSVPQETQEDPFDILFKSEVGLQCIARLDITIML